VRGVLALGARCMACNHDLIALGRLGDERCIPLARASLRWTRSVLADDARSALAALPATARLDDVLLCHGWMDDPQRYVIGEQEAVARLREFHALPYDLAACREALRERGLPPGSCHLRPSRWRDAASAVSRRVRRMRSRRRAASGRG
jgi:hypothetical protein